VKLFVAVTTLTFGVVFFVATAATALPCEIASAAVPRTAAAALRVFRSFSFRAYVRAKRSR
jgi:hypothetical protein